MSVLLGSLFAAAFAVEPVSARDATALEDCNKFASQGHIAEYQCVDRNNERKAAQMENLYSRAIEKLQEHAAASADTFPDLRRSHVYLEWSQAAWKQFVDSHCTVVGGLMGGSNAWVSRYAVTCYSDELDRRIKFLETVVAGDYQGR
jgi:uncharacterized protein YecT (DUF1311 family)